MPHRSAWIRLAIAVLGLPVIGSGWVWLASNYRGAGDEATRVLMVFFLGLGWTVGVVSAGIGLGIAWLAIRPRPSPAGSRTDPDAPAERDV